MAPILSSYLHKLGPEIPALIFFLYHVANIKRIVDFGVNWVKFFPGCFFWFSGMTISRRY